MGSWGLEDEVAAVIVGSPSDVAEATVVDGAEQRTIAETTVHEVLNSEASPAVESNLKPVCPNC